MHFSNGCIELSYGSSTQIRYGTSTKFPLLSDFSSDSFYFSICTFRNDKFQSKVNHLFVRAFVGSKASRRRIRTDSECMVERNSTRSCDVKVVRSRYVVSFLAPEVHGCGLYRHENETGEDAGAHGYSAL